MRRGCGTTTTTNATRRLRRRLPSKIAAAGALAAVLGAAASARASEVAVTVSEVESGEGSVIVAVCTKDTFLGRDCPHVARAPAAAGETRVVLEDVPPGEYAVQAIHDANDNLDIDRNLIGWPLEGVGFSNDAPMRMGPPRYEDARVEIDDDDAALRLRMRYY